MSDVTIKQLAGVLGMSVDKLLTQLDGYALQTQRAITIPLIRSMLENE